MAGKNILLVEPSYKNKYPPLGLMKIAQYHGPRGKQDTVRFIKGEKDRSVFEVPWDRVYVTTLFSFEWARIEKSIDFALEVVAGRSDRVFVGGIAASLMHDRFLATDKWSGVRFIKGLLTVPPAESLQLDDFAEELYADDRDSTPIEDLIPDYSILEQIDYQYPVRDAYFTYASRGCVRSCTFCGVPKLEGAQRDVASVPDVVNGIAELYGEKKDLILMDNNIVASPRFREIIAEIRNLGFTAGAKLRRGRVPVQRRVDFNQGVDARILCKSPFFLEEMATICLKPLRIAFDHLGLRKPYEQAIRYAKAAGLSDLSNYMLYNYHDSPPDLFDRMRLNVALNEELGVQIFSFPMRYQPTDLPDRSHVGKHWNRYFLRSMQIVLQATHGIVSGAPNFFKRAFGDNFQEFEAILMRPHRFIFNRDWYEFGDGVEEYHQFLDESSALDRTEQYNLIHELSDLQPPQYIDLVDSTRDSRKKRVLKHYIHRKDEEFEIWRKSKNRSDETGDQIPVPADQLVEDAGLEDDSVFGTQD